MKDILIVVGVYAALVFVLTALMVLPALIEAM